MRETICCKTCGSDTRNRSQICNRCTGKDSARRHTEEEAVDDDDNDSHFDRYIADAIRDAIDID